MHMKGWEDAVESLVNPWSAGTAGMYGLGGVQDIIGR